MVENTSQSADISINGHPLTRSEVIALCASVDYTLDHVSEENTITFNEKDRYGAAIYREILTKLRDDLAKLPSAQTLPSSADQNPVEHKIGTIEITNSKTGEVRKFNDHSGDVFDAYHWTEGNYGCDCNRILFFAQANGEEGDFDAPCTHGTPSYRLRIFSDHGEVLYDDTKSTETPFVIAHRES